MPVTLSITESTYAKPVGILFFGAAVGYVLQRSRFCIFSAFADLILFKDPTLFKAVILLITISTLGFVILQVNGKEGYIVAIGWRTLLGGVLFGIGMALAGGCAVGTLMRLGEEHVLFAVVLLGLITGGALGAYHYTYWGTSPYSYAVFLPNYLGWQGSVFALLFLFLIIWIKVDKR